MLAENINMVSKVITFFFPYDSKVDEYEYTEWYPGDPRDFSEGHPHGHEVWGHGQSGWWEKDASGWHWYWEDDDSTPRSTQKPSVIATTRSPLATSSTPSEIHEAYSDSLLSVVLGFYALLLVAAFASNILLANVIKKYRWNSSVVLQIFAIVAWIDHFIGFALLIFVMYLAIFCFKFYWNNKTRSVEWGRSYVLYALVSTWIIAFLLAGFTAFFQCDSHINQQDQCIKIVCAVSNIFSSIFTELLTRVRIVIPIVIIFLILLSVRVGSSHVRRESMVKVEGADIHGDRELLLMCSLVFGIYELSIIVPQLLIYFCISPLISVGAWHFGVLFSTLATPIAVLSISRNTRDRMWLLYTFSRKGKNAPQGSYAHTAKKYHESVEAGKNRRPSGVSMFSQELSSSSFEKQHQRKLSMIMEEPSKAAASASSAIVPVETVPNQQFKPPAALSLFSRTPKLTNVVRVQSADQAVRHTNEYDHSKRRMSHHDMPQVGDTDRLATLVNSKTQRFSLGNSRPTVNMHLPNHIFVHHIHHENKIRPMELAVNPHVTLVE
ncbi:unnamed protein product [Caenorhabditis sp. 36 PRJEB53466]|nr:unnamed protein product [Caenorhabditis sp. 36 PRJEB53466]